ncbi:MAG: SPOR domain-containing protein [Bacteroidota bacterium]
MLLRKEFFLLFLVIMIAFPVLAAHLPEITPGGDSARKVASQDEIILFNMINDMRLQGKLQHIPLSPNLCIVAHTHIDDLILSKPQDKGCSLQGWSANGKWTACCNSKDPAGIQCMKSKPKEITGYPGLGYELIYWGDEKATPADAAALWKQVDASADMILCRGKWKGYQWKALGVGIKDGYAVLWLGDKADKTSPENLTKNQLSTQPTQTTQPGASVSPGEKMKKIKSSSVASQTDVTEIVANPKESTKESIKEPGTKYYLVVASVKTPASAKSELRRFQAKGYPEAMILEGESVYRICVKSFDTEKKARLSLNQLKAELPGIWVFKK